MTDSARKKRGPPSHSQPPPPSHSQPPPPSHSQLRLSKKLPDYVQKLILGYEMRTYYFELIECGRKLSIVCLPVLIQVAPTSCSRPPSAPRYFCWNPASAMT